MTGKTAPKPITRPAVAADHDAVAALVAEAYAPWVPIIDAVPGPMRDDYRTAIAKGHVTVLEIAKVIEALLVLIPLDDALLLDNVATAPEAQGQGHSSHLMALAEARARDTGYDVLRLYTHAKMAANISLYERRGFQISAQITERGLPRIYMEKRLGLHDP